MLRPTSLVPVLAVGLLMACGGKSFETGDGPEGGSAGSPQAGSSNGARDGGGSSSGGTGSGGGNHGGTSSGGKANGGSGGSDQCDPADYADDTGGSVPVRIVNKTAKPIYLGQETLGCASGPTFQVADAMGQPLASPGFCQTTCEMLLKGMVIGCPAIACAIGGVTTLQPGEDMLSQWSALRTETLELPAACQTRTGATECVRIADVEPGTYYFSAQAASNMQCGMGPDGAASCGTCSPIPSGGCVTYGAVITGPLLQAKVEVMLDGSYGIGGPGGGGMVREVVIEFQE